MMKDVYIVDALRTAVGTFGGTLAETSAAALARTVVEALLTKNGLSAEMVDEVLLGNVLQAGQGQNIARQVLIGAGIPKEKTAATINMVCGSGLRAVAMAAQAIKAGDAKLIVAGGTENMSLSPYLLPKARTGYRMGNGELVDSMIRDGLWDVFNNYHMGITAENLAEKYGISREEQDAFAAASQAKAAAARDTGRFTEEIIPVLVPQKKGDPVVFDKDEHIRQGVTLESLSKMKPAFKKDGTVTAGNSSGINDGAAAVIVAGEEFLAANNVKPLARIVSYAYAGVDPAIMGIGPKEAVRQALRKAGWGLGDLGLIEANEAFAAQSLSIGKELAWDKDIVNVNGGAIALGHPIGASGARILTTLLHEMKKRSAKKGLAALCIGGGMGIALCAEIV